MPSTSGSIDPAEGRTLFGIDPANYAEARPDYPDQIYAVLRERCGLGPGRQVVEIGPATGIATRHLAEADASVVAVEPDPALAAYLTTAMAPFGAAVDVQVAAFEDVELAAESFDLAVAATSFHWVDQPRGLTKVLDLLRPGGWWAGWWNVFGDPARADPFHDATQPWLADLDIGPGFDDDGPPFELDLEHRFHDLAIAGFDQVECEQVVWTLTLTSAEVRNLYATYSSISRLERAEQARILSAIARVADEQFDGRVERNMITVLYTARRPPSS
jgi:SAM-dependent methyltransferase